MRALRLGLVDRSGPPKYTHRQRDYGDTGRDQSRGELVGSLVRWLARDGWVVGMSGGGGGRMRMHARGASFHN